MRSRLVARFNYRSLPAVGMVILMVPLFLYIATCWLVRPLSLTGSISASSLIPATFVTGLLFLRLPRRQFLHQLGNMGFELGLLLIMTFLCMLSLINSSEPFRAFRILFPCGLGILIFIQLIAIRGFDPQVVDRIPRMFVVAGLLFSSLPLLLAHVSGAAHSVVFFGGGHRSLGFFENANQHSIMLSCLVPVAIAEFSVNKLRARKLLWGLAALLLIYGVMRTGSKTGLIVTLSVGWTFFLIINIRSLSAAKRVLLCAFMAVIAVAATVFGIPLLKAVDPVFAGKLKLILSDGVTNYYSIESRQLLWNEAIEQGQQHWLIGSGAGERILGVAHAHNLILTYFSGIGIFGALAILLLCLRILWRGGAKAIRILFYPSSDCEKRHLGCFVSACVYVLCNQLSDSFGPTTIAGLWLIYLPAAISACPQYAGRASLEACRSNAWASGLVIDGPDDGGSVPSPI